MDKYANTLQVKLSQLKLPLLIDSNQNVYKYIKETYKLNYDFFILSNSKPIGKEQTFKDIPQNTIWQIEPCQKGGGIIDMFMGIIKLGEFFLLLPDIIKWILKTILWIIRFIPWLLTDFLNPKNIASDVVHALRTVVLIILKTPIDIFFAFMAFGANTMGTVFGGFWGWDQSNLSKADKNSTYFEDLSKCGDKKCYLTKTNTVPFSILLGTIVCPPLGVFMVYGITGWINIVISIFLTFAFYVPGLLYALLIIYM
jgi:uncharacterized membrane protein YqaE (UPF0057 family)